METPENTGDRWSRGVTVMERIQGEEGAAAIRSGFERLFPDFGRYVVERDVFAERGIDPREGAGPEDVA